MQHQFFSVALACIGAGALALAFSANADAQTAVLEDGGTINMSADQYGEDPMSAAGTLRLCCDCTLQGDGTLKCTGCTLKGATGCGSKDEIVIETPQTGQSGTFCDPEYAYEGTDLSNRLAIACWPEADV